MKSANIVTTTILLLIASVAFAVTPWIQNEDIKSQAQIQAAILQTTGNTTATSACLTSLASTAGLSSAGTQFVYDITTPGNIPSAATVVGVPGSCGSGQVQISAPANGTATADVIVFGGQANQLPNDDKLWIKALGINDTLNHAITTGVIGTAAIIPTNSYELSNLGLAAAVASNALTLSLKQADGLSNPGSGAAAVLIGYQKTSQAGGFNLRSITSATAITIPSGTTIGTVSGITAAIYLYAIDNAGTTELAVSLSSSFDEGIVQNTTAVSGGSSATTLYSATARTGVPIRMIGRVQIAETVAGTWATGATSASPTPFGKTPMAPKVITFTASGTYTPTSFPRAPSYIRIKMCGGGGGGGAGGIGGSPIAGTAGGSTSFGSLVVATGGQPGAEGDFANFGGAGGTSGTTAAGVLLFDGNPGNPSILTGNGDPSGLGNIYAGGGNGGASPFGGAGAGVGGVGPGVTSGKSATGYCSGGGGAGLHSLDGLGGSGGGSGEYAEGLISNPTSQAVTIGANGAGQRNATIGGNGFGGIVIIEEYFQ